MKTKFFIPLALIALIVTSCIVSKERMKSVNDAALVSLYLNRNINMSEFGNAAAGLSKLVQDDAFDLKPLVTKLKSSVEDDMVSALPFKLVDEQKVITSEKYEDIFNAQPVLAKISRRQVEYPEGYYPINSASKAARAEAISAFPFADGFLYVSVDYKLVKTSMQIAGFGKAKIEANLNVRLVDRNNKIVLKVQKRAKSENNIKFALGGVFDAKKIKGLCEEATDEVTKDLLEYVNKRLNK